MARFLFCVWPAPGHVYPSLPIARALRERGHDVAYVTYAEFEPVLRGFDVAYFPLRSRPSNPQTRQTPLRGADARAIFRALFILPASAMARMIDRAADEFRPDVLVHDQRSFGPVLVAQRRGLPLATLAMTCCPLPGGDLAPFGLGLPPAADEATRLRYAAMRRHAEDAYAPVLAEWNAIRAGFGLPPHAGPLATAAVSDRLLILPTVPELDYNRADLPPRVRYVGPCTWDPPASLTPETAAWLASLPEAQPLALVTASTAAVGPVPDRRSAALVEAAVAALPEAGIAVLATLPYDHPLHGIGSSPAVHIVRFAPHRSLLGRTSVAVTHGGFGIVSKAVQQAVPLVVVPFAGDQPEVAQRVVASGVGRRLAPDALNPGRLHEAVGAVLQDPQYRANATRVAAAMALHDGPREAAALLSDLAAHRAPISLKPERNAEVTV
ncbi:MAG TPA: glycosyltransferase [Chloroflexota bacterium]|nr:glycosyltransferase [Chloroflexota bacterium]